MSRERFPKTYETQILSSYMKSQLKVRVKDGRSYFGALICTDKVSF